MINLAPCDLHSVAIVTSSTQVLAQLGYERTRQLLSAAELARAARSRRRVDHDDLIASHAVARLLIATMAGLDQEQAGPHTLVQRCPSCEATDHGQPTAAEPGIAVTWSHANGLVVVAATTTQQASTARLGCDIEPLPGPVLQREGRQLDIATWCRIECEVKAGLGDLDSRLSYWSRSHHSTPPSHPGLTWTERNLSIQARPARLAILSPTECEVVIWS